MTTRRNMLAGAAGAIGALAAGSLARDAKAADGDPIILGGANTETGITTISSTGADSAVAIEAYSQLHGAFDVVNHSGDAVWGRSVNDLGVLGNSQTGTGIKGESISSGHGMHGVAHDAEHSGVFGESDIGDGVRGSSSAQSGDSIGVRGLGEMAGVGGFSNTGPDSIGVLGHSLGFVKPTAGTGVSGLGDKSGVTGFSTAGTGVQGVGPVGVAGRPSSGGTGVMATAADDGSGLALRAQGPTAFSLSGILSIGANAKSGIVSGVSLRSGSLVLATVQNDLGIPVDSAVPDVAGSTITVNLGKTVPAGKTAKVAWFVVN
jgi:hypothetical protein